MYVDLWCGACVHAQPCHRRQRLTVPSSLVFSASAICTFILYSLTMRVLTSAEGARHATTTGRQITANMNLWGEYSQQLCSIQYRLRTISFGWCSPNKELLFIDAISSLRLATCGERTRGQRERERGGLVLQSKVHNREAHYAIHLMYCSSNWGLYLLLKCFLLCCRNI